RSRHGMYGSLETASMSATSATASEDRRCQCCDGAQTGRLRNDAARRGRCEAGVLPLAEIREVDNAILVQVALRTHRDRGEKVRRKRREVGVFAQAVPVGIAGYESGERRVGQRHAWREMDLVDAAAKQRPRAAVSEEACQWRSDRQIGLRVSEHDVVA